MTEMITKWQVKPLGKVAKIERNSVAPEAIRSGSLYVGLENITGNGCFEGVREVNNGELASNKFVFTCQHILYGKLRPYLSKIARPGFSGICSTDILPLLPGKEINRDYLFHFLRQPEIVQLATTRSTGANLPRLSPSELAQFEIPLPKLEEQERIAAILDKADDIRRKRREIITISSEFCKSVFLHMFHRVAGRLSGKYIATADSQMGIELKSLGWKRTTIGREIQLQRGIDITKRDHLEGTVPVISSGGINGYHNQAIAKGPGVVLGRKGSVGAVYFVETDYWPHDTTLWVREFNFSVPRFVFEFFRQFPINEYEASTANPSLNRNNIHPVEAWWPPVAEQLRFAQICENYERNLLAHIRKASEDAKALFDSLVQQAFKGEL